MKNLTSLSLLFLAAGILTSVSILSAYQVLFTISLIYFTFKAFKEHNLKLPVSAYWLLAFTAVALISSTLNMELMPKPSKNFGRLKYFLYGVGGIYVFRYWLIDASDKTKKIIAHTFLASVIIAAIYALSTYIFTTQKRARPITETMRYGYGSSMFLLTMFSAYLHNQKFKNWINSQLLLAALILGFLGMFFSYTRGALLGFLCGLPFVFFYFRKKLVIYVATASIVIIGSLATFYFFGNQTVVKFRLLSTRSFSSDEIRTSQWNTAIHAIKEKPVLGWGLSNFHTQVERIKKEYDLGAKDYVDAHSHNLFLEIAAGTGLVGLFLFLGWLISWAIESFRANSSVTALVIPFGVAFIVGSQFEVTFDANNASMIFAFYSMTAAIAYTAKHQKTSI